MTLEAGFKHLLASAEWKSVSKGKDSLGGAYRKIETRFKKNELGEKVIIQLLEQYGYTVKKSIVVTKPK